jgi:hypothetical protein
MPIMQHGPSHLLVIIVSHGVILLLDRIHNKIPSGISPKYSRLLCRIFLLVIFPPMFDMGERLKDFKGDHFFVKKIVDKEIAFY